MIRGSCLCGAIRYEADSLVGPLGHCHCQMCRKAHGSAFSSVVGAARSGFRWTQGEDLLARFESSPGKSRCFCSRCGSHLIATRDANPDSLMLRAGCIDSGEVAPGVAHCWVESRAPWFEIGDGLPQFQRGFPNASRKGR